MAELFGPAWSARYRFFASIVLLAIVAFAQIARIGTLRARIVAASILALATFGPLAWAIVWRRKLRDPREVLQNASRALGKREVDRALSSLALTERIATANDHEGVSPALARLHAERSVARLDVTRLAPLGERYGAIVRWLALAAVAIATLVLAAGPSRVIEGIDVALARRGQAPLTLAWLDDAAVTVHPPAYLHKHDYGTTGYGAFSANRGAALVIRGVPRRSGRTLVLADEEHEVPFLDDGSGGVVAHWSVARSGHLRVRARFGDVVIEEPNGWDLLCIEDETPRVELEGAPGTIELAKAGGSIRIGYDAWDDHGLREVHLVVRIGMREERRVLAKLEGEPKHDRGGYVLRVTDPLINKARIPIRIRVEARDNDPITGPKWGRSAEITLVPPVIGAGDADRYEAMRAVRDRFVDMLARAMDGAKIEDVERDVDDASDATEALLGNKGISRVPPRIMNLLRGRIRQTKAAVAAEKKTPNPTTHAATLAKIERMVSGIDEAMRSLGRRDTKTIAKLLVDVCDDAARGLNTLPIAPADKLVEAKMLVDTDVSVIDGGGKSMRRLGELGRDLGEIVENDLRRVARAREAKDHVHAELAMRDLAARLREPVPSFGGSTNSSAPGEPTGEDDGEQGDQSEGEEAAGDQESQLEELAKKHGGTIGEVEDLLRAAEDPKALDGLEEEAKKRAKALRDAVAKLPKGSGMRKTLESAEGSLREKAESMAESLEKLQIGDARERGDSTMKSLEEAKERAWIEPGAEERLNDVGKEVQKQIDWMDDLLKKLRKNASEKSKEKVKGVAPSEKGHESRAKDIGENSEKKSPLPGDVKELLEQAQKKMGEAAKSLEKGDADQGLKEQRDAQKLLEKARDLMRGDEEPGGDGGDTNKFDPDQKVDIPDPAKGPEEFRKRVLKGLGSGTSSPKLQDAAKRYAEGLVK